MNFGDLAYAEHYRHYDYGDIYDEDDTYPQETDDYELWWAKKRLRRSLIDHEARESTGEVV